MCCSHIFTIYDLIKCINMQVGEPQAKKQKKEHALEKRIEELEQSKRNEGEEELKSLKAKVRGLCMQTEPSVPLILVLVEELASTAR